MKAFWRSVAFLVAAFYVLAPLAVLAQSASSTVVYQSPTCTMGVNPSVISPGGAVALSWNSTNASEGTISGVGGVGPSGSVNLLPSNASQTTFTGTFTGPGGTANCSATVQVASSPTVGNSSASGSTANPTDIGSATSVTNTGLTAPVTPVTSGNLAPIQSPNGGLVPCGIGSDPYSATSCQACDLAQLVQNLINFLIGLSIPIAAGLFAYAGVRLFLAGEVAERRNKAKEIFTNAFIGFLIAISGWLVINTFLHALLQGGSIPQGSWFTIQCVGVGPGANNRQIEGTVNQLLNSVLPSITTNSGSGSASGAPTQTPTCSGTDQLITQNGSSLCYNPDSDSYSDPTMVNTPGPLQSGVGDCSQGALSDQFDDPGDVAAMSCVLQGETSGCNPLQGSGVDRGSDGNSVSWGLSQVNISANPVQCDALAGQTINGTVYNGGAVNCPSAFTGAYTGSNHNVSVKTDPASQALFTQCRTMMQNSDCNLEEAQGILNKQGICAWGAAKACNVGC